MSLAQFAKVAEKQAKENRGSLGFVQDIPVIGTLVKYEKAKKGQGRLLVIKSQAGKNAKFYSYGLLDKLLEQNNIKPGDNICVIKRKKNAIKSGKFEGTKAWGCDFSFEKKAGGKGR